VKFTSFLVEKEEPVSEEGSGPEKNVIGPIAWCKAES
jgi:hypothetical protein